MTNANGARRHVREAFIIGVALTAALAGAQYIAYAGLRAPFVPYALAEIIRDITPGPIRAIGMESFMVTAKSLIVIFATTLYVLAGAGVAALYELVRAKLPLPHWIHGLLLGVLAFIVSLPPELARNWTPSDQVTGPLFLLVLYLLWGVALEQTIRGALARPDIPRDVDAPVMTRRDFLIQTAAGGAFVGLLASMIGRLTEAGLFDGLRGLNFPPAPTPDKAGFLPARGTWPEITPNERFYTVDIGVGSAPKIQLNQWKLRVEGLVDKPTEYNFDDLVQKFKSETPLVFAGTLIGMTNPVGGELTGTAMWEGIRLADVLKAAGVKADAKEIVFHCIDGYSDSLPVSTALDPDVFLVYRMNGVPLPYEHGFPVRVYSPNHYGEKSAKWLTRIEVVSEGYKGYWQKQGWTDEATIKHTAIINTPFGDNVLMLNDTTVEIGGIAHGGGRGVSKVELGIVPEDPTKNPITWIPATLKVPLSPYAWVLWKATFAAEPGKRYRLAVRMVDGKGTPQEEKAANPHPDGATGLHIKDIFTIKPEPTLEAKPTNQTIAPGQAPPPPKP